MRSLSGIRRIAGLLVGGALLLLTTGAISDTAVTKGSKAAGMDSCVAPTADMRRNHMDYLKHDRDRTVHKGVRDTRNSLAACIDCHAEKSEAGGYKPVNAEGQFCASCHSYVAVNLTCFQCHSTTPQGADEKVSQNAAGGAGLGLLHGMEQPLSLTRDELQRLHAKVEGN
ncbi:MAG: sulfur reduction protein DsrJ [Sedimenticola sp.]|nr:sulfur reduction protein DsrJ [Sedimenticola sp.]